MPTENLLPNRHVSSTASQLLYYVVSYRAILLIIEADCSSVLGDHAIGHWHHDHTVAQTMIHPHA